MKKQVLQIGLSVLTVLLISRMNLSAQNVPDAAPIVPLTPNAAELNKYSSIPVDGMTGVPSIGFPLYEINTGKIRLPISLNYHASGIKVRQKATWVGLGWSINAGGAISRGVRGKRDEHPINGWFNDPTSWTVLDQLWEKSYNGTQQEQRDSYYALANQWFVNPGHDTHPDFFSYSAGSKSGKFIFSRAKQKFVSFPFEPVKIDRDPVQNTYKITDDEGTVYFFEAKETAQIYSGTGEEEQDQSWYLTKIVSADGTDIISLNYETVGYVDEKVVSHSKTSKKLDNVAVPYESATIANESNSINSVLALKEIIFPQGKVTFFANTVRQDYVDKALDSIVIYCKQNGVYERVNKYSFNYDYFITSGSPTVYRLRLLSFKKEDVKGGQPEIHHFEYNPITLPRIDSYAADYWGFYNGANNNGSLLSQPVGDAYREADTNNVRAGMLERITYPAGGYTVFDFESNKYKSDIVSTKIWDLTSFRLYGVGNGVEVIKQENFQVPQDAYSSTMSYEIKFYPYVPGGEGTPQRVILKDLTTGTDIKTWEHIGDARALKTYSESYTFDRTHQYQFYAMVQNHPSTYIDFYMTYTKLDDSKLYRPGAGVRIRRIIAYDNDGTAKSAELYKYGETEDGIGKLLISDQTMQNNYYNVRYAQPTGSPIGVCCLTEYGVMTVYVGNIAYPSFSFMGSNLLYNYITKYQLGNGATNGKTVQQYNIPNDFKLLFNPRLPGGYELMDNSLYGEQLVKETQYAWDRINNNYRLVTEKQLKYKGYNGDVEKGIRLWEQQSYFMNSSCAQDKVTCFGATAGQDFHYAPYYITLGCYRLDNIVQKVYDDQGNVLQTTQNFEYNNALHLYPTSVTSINSKGETLKSSTKYPGDHTAAEPNSSVLDKMVSLNVLNKQFWSGDYKGSALLKYVQTIYNNQWNSNLNLVLPEKQQSYINAATPSLANYTEYKSYDSRGKPLLVTNKQGLYTGYIWDYLGSYPIAEITGTGSSVTESAVTSFESDGSGNWNIGSSTREPGGITGNSCYQLANGGVNKTGLNAGANYFVSYWTANGSAFNINGTQGTPVKGRMVNGWTYFEHKITGVVEVGLPQINGLIDELRLYPADAKVTTYTYAPLVGVTSVYSYNNTVVYYEYDGLGRLKHIRDQDNNILKTFDYKYQVQQ
jgi:YD repeat-containing protein